MVQGFDLSKRRVSGLLGLSESSLYYRGIGFRDESLLRERLKEICMKKPRYGRPRVTWYLRKIEGFKDNPKRIARIYRELKLQVGKRPKGKRQASQRRLTSQKPTAPNQIWAMDFVSDQLASGQRFRCLTLTDLYSRESPAIEVDRSLSGVRVSQVLDRLKASRGLPRAIICDNGTEFTCRAMDQWAYQNKVELKFIEPGKPNQNAYCESFNSRLRDECLNTQWFTHLSEAKNIIENWRKEFNEQRPHSSLSYQTPKQFAQSYYHQVAA